MFWNTVKSHLITLTSNILFKFIDDPFRLWLNAKKKKVLGTREIDAIWELHEKHTCVRFTDNRIPIFAMDTVYTRYAIIIHFWIVNELRVRECVFYVLFFNTYQVDLLKKKKKNEIWNNTLIGHAILQIVPTQNSLRRNISQH